MASARIQRWSLILSGFNYTIEYVKGSLNNADGLSRMPQISITKDYTESNYINLIKSENSFGLILNFKDIARETRRDPLLSKLSEVIQNGRVHLLKGNEFIPFRNKANELSVEHECILWGYRSIVPKKLQTSVLKELHSSHLGIVKTKMLARSYVWWPGMDSEIEELIRECIPCQELQQNPEKSSLIPWNPADSVWSRIHVDFAGPIKNFYLLIVIDSYSKWVEVFKSKEITSSFTVTKLRELFSRYGLVDVLVSDNGRQFTSEEFKMFLKINSIKHILTAPGHPATNGQAENFIKTLKKSISASLKVNDNACLDTIINRFLIDYRNTKHCATAESPSKVFLGRLLKTRLSRLKPPTTRQNLIESQNKNITNFKGKRNAVFSTGQRVMIRDYKNPNKPSWTQATINKRLGPRSYYCIITHNNRGIKRHVDQMRTKNISHNMEIGTTVQEEPPLPPAVEKSNSIIALDNTSNVPSSDQTTNIATSRTLRPRQERISYKE